MILVVLCREGLDKDEARQAANLLWKLGQREAEFYVWGDDADA